MRIDVAIDIHAPPQRVFAVLCDVERWPEWTSTVTRVQRLEHGAFGVGSSARLVQPKLRPAVWRVTEFNAARNFTWAAQAPGIHMQAGHVIEAQDAGSRVALSFRFSGILAPILSRLYRGLIRRYLVIEAQGLKQRSESSASAADLCKR
jgi:hypothetical protein